MLYNWLYPLHTQFSFLNVFRYQSFRIIYAAVTAFLIAFVLAPWVIRKLQEIKLGQQIRDDGPKRHLAKSGTPTMGGILIIFAVILSTLLWADISDPTSGWFLSRPWGFEPSALSTTISNSSRRTRKDCRRRKSLRLR